MPVPGELQPHGFLVSEEASPPPPSVLSPLGVNAKDFWALREAKPLPQRLHSGLSLVPDGAVSGISQHQNRSLNRLAPTGVHGREGAQGMFAGWMALAPQTHTFIKTNGLQPQLSWFLFFLVLVL